MSDLLLRPISIMNDAELVDALLDNPDDTLAYQLAYQVDKLGIIYRSGNNKGLFFSADDLKRIDDKSREDLLSEIEDLEGEVASLEQKLEELDLDRLTLGVEKAKRAMQQAHERIDYLLGLGGDK
tara:strand:+ start:47052 stop:47426 length:375 start_codon:yes stop_codon:yes gene_type:complete